jgi:inhibitor of nuclear factor kappa-B kinase subunit alpha
MMSDLRRLIVLAFQRGERQADIFRRFKDDGVSRQLISKTIKRWRETGSITNRPRTGRPRSVRTPRRIKAVRARIRRNPQRSQRKLASQMVVSRRSIQRIIKEDLGLMPFKRRKVHGLTMQQRGARLERSKALLRRYANEDLERIVFSDEKLFVIEEHLNAQNDRVYAAAFEDIPEWVRTVQRFQKPGSVMVWGAVSSRGKLPLVFVEPGVKVNKEYYLEAILDGCLKAGAQRVFGQGQWTFQQDSAPAHRAKIVQDWCRAEIPDFIQSSEWPPSSPDLNPLDYSIWGILKAKVNAIQHRSVDSLKKTLRNEWTKLPMSTVRNSVASWRRRLQAVVKKRGGRFE